MTVTVVKRNKRLWIEDDETGETIYTPPDFVRMQSREPFLKLALDMMEPGAARIGLIIAFETAHNPRSRRRP